MKKISFLSLSLALSSALCSAKTNYEELVTFYKDSANNNLINDNILIAGCDPSIEYDFSIAGNNFYFDYPFGFADNMDVIEDGFASMNSKIARIFRNVSKGGNLNESLTENLKKEFKITAPKILEQISQNTANIEAIQSVYKDARDNAGEIILTAQENPEQQKQIILDGIMQVSENLNQKYNISTLAILNRSKTIRRYIAQEAKRSEEKALYAKQYAQFKEEHAAKIAAVSQ